jgi:carbon-monoxide dehydrogenase medium subunit
VNLACSVSASGVTRFAFGAVGPRPFLVTDETGALSDVSAPVADQDRALRMLTSQAAPISNVRASQEYRQAMLEVLSWRALDVARARLNERISADG